MPQIDAYDCVMKYFLPLTKENPRDAASISHKLMLKAGLIRQTAAGIFAWLPLGTRVLNKIIQIIREEQNRIDAQEFVIPMIQTAKLWETSGRYSEYGQEMLRIKDQYERELVFTPTNEEQMTSLFQNDIHSYRDLPQLWYTIQWKFRDEIRPRAGVMRSREFLMLDTYSFDTSVELSLLAYRRVFLSFLRTFVRIGVPIIPAQSSGGLIGGDFNHEFLLPCANGETKIFCPKSLLECSHSSAEKSYQATIAPWQLKIDQQILQAYQQDDKTDEIFDYWQQNSAYTEESSTPQEKLEHDYNTIRGIELGHTFHFGTKYTKAFDINIPNADGESLVPQMGSYGIGVTRLVAAIIEVSHDEKGIIWPKAVAPFDISIINLQGRDDACQKYCQKIYNSAQQMGLEVLLDNSHDSPGVKLAKHDLMGIPTQLIIGPAEQETETVLIKNRASQERFSLQLKSCLNHLKVLK